MKNFKKFKKAIISLMLALVIVIPIFVFADANPKFSMKFYNEAGTEITKLSPGDKVKVEIHFENTANKLFSGYGISLNYDSSAFKVIDFDDPNTRPGTTPAQIFAKAYFDDGYSHGTVATTFVGLDEFEGTEAEKEAAAREAGKPLSFGGISTDPVAQNGLTGIAWFQVKSDAAGTKDFTLDVRSLVLIDENNVENEQPYDIEATKSLSIEVPATDFTVDSTNLVIKNGDTKTIGVTSVPSNATTDANKSFESDATSIATVDANGVVTAVGNGTAHITVNAYGLADKTKTVTVTVTNPVEDITLSDSSAELNKGGTKQLTATAVAHKADAPATDSTTITWESLNTDIATVSESGLVTAVKGGTATIRAKISDTLYKDCTVKVVVPMTNRDISINTGDVSQTINLGRGDTRELTVTWGPKDTTDNTTVEFESSNTDVVALSASSEQPVDGEDKMSKKITMTAVGGGDATVTVKLGGVAFGTINVHVNVPIESIEIAEKGTGLSILPTQEKEYNVTVTPNDTSEMNSVTATSDTEGVATAEFDKDNRKLKITAVAPGNATVTVTDNNGHSDTIAVKVLVPVEGVTISSADFELNRGASKDLTATITPANQEEAEGIVWSSSDTNIATVDNTGKVTAVAAGNAVITATAGRQSATVNVKVVVPVESLTLDKTNMEVERGETGKLNLTINPSDYTEQTPSTPTWTSSDEAVATVDNQGNITAKAIGDTVIEVSFGGKSITANVKVIASIKAVKIDQVDPITINKGATTTLTATLDPVDTTTVDKTLTWTSLTPDIASVDATGLVTGLKNGTAKIQVETSNGKKAVKEIEVVIPITSFTTASTLDVYRGKNNATKIDYVINPEDTTEDKTITWTSSDETIATVDENGVVTGLKEGSVTITGSLLNGKFTSNTSVTIKIIPLTDIKVEIPKEILKGSKNSKEIKVTPVPANTTEFENLKITSSDESILSIKDNSILVGNKEGTVTVTVTVGDITKEFEVAVKEIHTESIELTFPVEQAKSFSVGDDMFLSVNVFPANTTDDLEYIFESSDPSILTVDKDGKVTAHKAGTATVTVRTTANGKTYESKSILTIAEATNETTDKGSANVTNSPKTGVESYIGYLATSLATVPGIAYVGYRRFKNRK